MSEQFDAIVIGGGPGGYVAAIRVAQLGGKVVLVEKNKLGGVCNNYGCIPSKTMIRLGEIQSNIPIADSFGIKIAKSGIDIKKLVENRNALLTKLSNGVGTLLKLNGVKVIFGTAEIKSKNEIQITDSENKTENLLAKNIIIATGSSVARPKLFSTSKNIMSSEEFLIADDIPKNILIVGGGPEGVEFASMLTNFDCDVTIIEMLDRLVPQEDTDVSTTIEKVLKKNGVNVLTGFRVVEVKDDGNTTRIKIEKGNETISLNAEKILVSIGRKPNTHGIGLENAGVNVNEFGRIVVNDKMETSAGNIYAIGDVIGGRYAHEAMENGVVAAQNCMGLNSSMKNQVIPRCIYTLPEIACVGLTEDEAKKDYDIDVGKFFFKASGRAMTMGNTDGFVKVILDKKTRSFLGIHIVNERASDIVGEAVLAIKHLKSDDIISAIYPHPTLVEGFKEAVMNAYGRSIHYFSQKTK
ncbi:MAG: dihydrolipoyl dehydrogenase [Candidatus Aenigmarchaeota archaeon]|nr:dihydrolipoyl dehydrogenase [Candidatus Aenigmarchaeota archaeon]